MSKRVTQKRWLARRRQPATFNVRGRSAAFPGVEVEWTVVVTETGYVATRRSDGRRVAIGWKEAIGIAMFEGRDSARGEDAKL